MKRVGTHALGVVDGHTPGGKTSRGPTSLLILLHEERFNQKTVCEGVGESAAKLLQWQNDIMQGC